MKPSVGRIVHYSYPYSDTQVMCFAALVLHVELAGVSYEQDTGRPRTEDVVVLKIFNPGGGDFVRTACEGSGAGMWHWPERVQ